jgi:hypothetical protein
MPTQTANQIPSRTMNRGCFSMPPKCCGIVIALIELTLFALIATAAYIATDLIAIDYPSYLWACFTILTGVWEFTYILKYDATRQVANHLIASSTHVWRNRYSLKWVLPWKLPILFYAEYAAYADREYMSIDDFWSKIIESTHAFYCGFFCLIALTCHYLAFPLQFYTLLAVAMGCQLMNSILYCGQYILQTNESYSVNHDTPEFPCGKLCLKRPFMYVNVFWTIMPIYVIIQLLY